jgi:general secretion pathway protein J
MQAKQGFTLLELLVALAVLAVLAVLGTRGLTAVLDGEARASAEIRRWNDVSLAVGQVGRDLSLAITAPVMDSDGSLIIDRLGDGDANRLQSGVRRVGYRVRAGALEYLLWPQYGPGLPAAYPALAGVAAVDWQVLVDGKDWSPVGTTRANVLPRALRLAVTLATGEQLVKVFTLR